MGGTLPGSRPPQMWKILCFWSKFDKTTTTQIACFISILVKLDKNPQISWPQVWCCITIPPKIMSTITNSWPVNSWRVVRNDTMKISWPWPKSFLDGGWPLKKKLKKMRSGDYRKYEFMTRITKWQHNKKIIAMVMKSYKIKWISWRWSWNISWQRLRISWRPKGRLFGCSGDREPF